MAKFHLTKAGKKILGIGLFFLVVGAGLGITGAVLYNMYGGGANSSLPPGSTLVVNLGDSMNSGVTIPKDEIDCTLYGLKPGRDYRSSSSWEAISGVSNVADLTQTVVENALEDYDQLYLDIAESTVQNTANTFNDDYGDRTYQAISYPIVLGTNNLGINVKPSSAASILIWNSVTGAQITTANITVATNFTVALYLNNQSEGAYDQRYVGYVSKTGVTVDVRHYISFTNATGAAGAVIPIAIGDLVASNLATESEGSNALSFHTSELGQSTIVSQFRWGADAIAAAKARIVSPNSVGIVAKFGTTSI